VRPVAFAGRKTGKFFGYYGIYGVPKSSPFINQGNLEGKSERAVQFSTPYFTLIDAQFCRWAKTESLTAF